MVSFQARIENLNTHTQAWKQIDTQTDDDENHISAHVQWCESQGIICVRAYNYSLRNQANDSHATLQTQTKECQGEGEKSMHEKTEFQRGKVQTWEQKKSREWWWGGWTQRQGGWRTREECFCLWCRGEKSNQPCVIQSGMERCTFASVWVCVQREWCILLSCHTTLFSQTHTHRGDKQIAAPGPSRAADLGTLSWLPPIGWLTLTN